MNKRAILGALGGAIVGAILWGTITYFTGYEIGWIAWAIGGMVGGAARALGSSDKGTAIACALLAVGSIFVGKMLAVEFALSDFIKTIDDSVLTEAFYEETKADALAFSQLQSEAEYADFMVKHDFRGDDATGDVTEEEIANFKEETVPMLKKFHAEQPSYEEWKHETKEDVALSVQATTTTIDVVISTLGLLDIVFALLGIGTAYKLALGDDE